MSSKKYRKYQADFYWALLDVSSFLCSIIIEIGTRSITIKTKNVYLLVFAETFLETKNMA